MNLKLGTAVLNQTPLDWIGNRERVRAALWSARQSKVDVLCLPELCLSGYGCEDAFFSEETSQLSLRILEELLGECGEMVVTFGLALRYKGALFNSVVLVANGQPIGAIPKQTLSNSRLCYEKRWFSPWKKGESQMWDSPLGRIPFGDHTPTVYHQGQPIRVAVEIGREAHHRGEPGQEPIDILLNPSADHFALGRRRLLERSWTELASVRPPLYLYSNLNGNEAGRVVYDGGGAIVVNGETLACSSRLSLKEWQVTTATVTLSPEGQWSACQATATEQPAEWETSTQHRYEEFSRAASLGLIDYLRKSRSRGFVLSLSGGVDSAACAALIALAQKRLTTELSSEEQKAKFSYWPEFDSSPKQFLTTIYQATRNSGEITRTAAQILAEEIGSHHVEYDVDAIVESYRTLAEQTLGRELTWEKDDLCLQNIQARARAPGPWMVANALGALMVATSNRSESAVGYTTMDGDTSGGIAPLAGIDKSFLCSYLVWAEKEGPCGYPALGSLKAVNRQVPTAELRPPGSSQTDEDDLMPYPVLEKIEEMVVRDSLGPNVILDKLSSHFSEYSVAQLSRWVKRFFGLFSRNQWKRERYAPSFHLDDHSLDPKTWYRFPILNGGYSLELKELNASSSTQRSRDSS